MISSGTGMPRLMPHRCVAVIAYYCACQYCMCIKHNTCDGHCDSRMPIAYCLFIHGALCASPLQNTGITPLSVGCVMGDLSLVQKLVHAMRLKLSRIGKPYKAVSVRRTCPIV